MSTAGELERRIAAARSSPAWSNYQLAREQVLAWLDAPGTDVSAYWREELRGFEYLLDAGPLIIEQLRHHMYHVTGLRPYDYRTGKDVNRAWMAEKLEELVRRAGGRELFVPENHALGGFGFDIDGALVNLDTIKFFESAIALADVGVMDDLRSGGERRLVWEIGAGWGGFAYALKTLAPDVTYAIVDLPQTFLFSIPYLTTVFPEARIRCFDATAPDTLWRDWQKLDFLFVPHWALDSFDPPRLDLTLNTVSFQEMTSAQVRSYVERAHTLGTRWLYSLNRDRSIYNDELSSVRELLASRFVLHEIEVLPVPYVSPLSKPKPAHRASPQRRMANALSAAAARKPRPGPSAAPAAPVDTYRHVVGTPL